MHTSTGRLETAAAREAAASARAKAEEEAREAARIERREQEAKAAERAEEREREQKRKREEEVEEEVHTLSASFSDALLVQAAEQVEHWVEEERRRSVTLLRAQVTGEYIP